MVFVKFIKNVLVKAALFTGLLLLFFTGISFASDGGNGLWFFTISRFPGGGVYLLEMGMKENPRRYKGEFTKSEAMGLKIATVHLSIQEFEKQYEFCALAGIINPTNASNSSCHFGFSPGSKDYFFEATGSDNLPICKFVCKEKEASKN